MFLAGIRVALPQSVLSGSNYACNRGQGRAMKMRKMNRMDRVNCRLTLLMGACLVLGLGADAVQAGPLPITVLCPGTASTGDREFSLTAETEAPPPSLQGDATVACHATGLGNDNGAFAGEIPAWTLIDKDNEGGEGTCETCFSITGINGTSGSFSISPTLWSTFNQLLIGFKAGEANGFGTLSDPDWAAFRLTGGITGGDWSITERWALSHASLWGRVSGGQTVTATPEPASLLLFGAGLLGASLSARRRHKANRR